MSWGFGFGPGLSRAQGMKFLSVDLKVYSELETNFQRHGSANFRLIQKRVNELLLLTSSSSASYKFDQRKIIPSEEPTKYCSFFKLATTSTWLFTLWRLGMGQYLHHQPFSSKYQDSNLFSNSLTKENVELFLGPMLKPKFRPCWWLTIILCYISLARYDFTEINNLTFDHLPQVWINLKICSGEKRSMLARLMDGSDGQTKKLDSRDL